MTLIDALVWNTVEELTFSLAASEVRQGLRFSDGGAFSGIYKFCAHRAALTD